MAQGKELESRSQRQNADFLHFLRFIKNVSILEKRAYPTGYASRAPRRVVGEGGSTGAE